MPLCRIHTERASRRAGVVAISPETIDLVQKHLEDFLARTAFALSAVLENDKRVVGTPSDAAVAIRAAHGSGEVAHW